MLTRLQILSKSKKRGAPVGVELQHLHRISQVEVEDLVGIQLVHLREGAGSEQVVDRRAVGPPATGQFDSAWCNVCLAEVPALDRMRFQVEPCLDFVCVHHHGWYQRQHDKITP